MPERRLGFTVGNQAVSRRHRGRWLPALVCLLSAALACRGAGGGPALVFTPDQLGPANVGQPYSAIITITQNATPVGQMTVAKAGLPPGLTFRFNKGQDAAELSGTPLQAGTYTFTVSAWCFGTNVSGQTGHHDYQLVVQ